MKADEKILSIINEEIKLFEADVDGHAFNRIKERLDLMTRRGDITPDEDAEIRRNLNGILKHEFDSKGYGIFLGGFKPNPKSTLYTDKNEFDPGIPFYQIFSNDGIFAKDSTGDEMWAIVRNNTLKTVMLRKSLQRRSMGKERNQDGGLGVDVPVPNLDRFLSLEKERKATLQQKELERQKELEGKILIDGVWWGIDIESQKIFKKNNPKIYVTFDEVLDYPHWNDKTKEEILNRIA